MDYRGLASYLRARANRGLLRLVGLEKAPSKRALVEAFHRLPPSYMRMVNERLMELFKGGAWQPTQRASARGATRRG